MKTPRRVIIPTFGAHVVPNPEHPLYDKLKEQPIYTATTLARHALIRHVRLKQTEVQYHLNLMCGVQLGSLSNKKDWDDTLHTLDGDYGSLTKFINASTYFMGLMFSDTNEYHSFIDSNLGFIEMQFASNNLTPLSVKKDYSPELTKALLLENPVILFIVMVFLGGPLSDEERKAITLSGE